MRKLGHRLFRNRRKQRLWDLGTLVTHFVIIFRTGLTFYELTAFALYFLIFVISYLKFLTYWLHSVLPDDAMKAILFG